MSSPNQINNQIPQSIKLTRGTETLTLQHFGSSSTHRIMDVLFERADSPGANRLFRSTNEVINHGGEIASLFTQYGPSITFDFLEKQQFVRLDPSSQVELVGELVSTQRLTSELHPDQVKNPIDELDEIIATTLGDPQLMSELCGDFAELQTKELFLVDPESYRRTFPDLCIRPIILDPLQEQRLSELVYAVLTAKIAIVNSLKSNPDLFELIYQDADPVMREIFLANLDTLPDSVRVRLDTHTSVLPGPLTQIETNGSEPQGDAVTTATLSLFKRLVARQLSVLGATPEQIEYCFSEFRLPIHQIGDEIEAIYAKNRVTITDLPETFNVGVFAWKHYKTRAPLSNISNTEADESAKHLKQTPTIDDATSFDPFDIVGFQTLSDTQYHIPIIRKADGTEIPIHFIRRLSGNMSGRGKTWGTLKEKNPEIYYKFTGIFDQTYNPLGAKIPSWMWMNPLNPALTDKALDAVLTDPKLAKRFDIDTSLYQELKRRNPEWTRAQVRDEKKRILSLCKSFIPQSRLLRKEGTSLFPGDSKKSALLNEQDVNIIKASRRELVLKLDTLHGYSGGGIYVGRSFFLNEVPEKVLGALPQEKAKIIEEDLKVILRDVIDPTQIENLNALSLRQLFADSELVQFFPEEYRAKESLAQIASEIEARAGGALLDTARSVVWPSLIDYAFTQSKSMIQQYREPHPFNAIRLSYAPDKGVQVSPPYPHIVDVNPFTFGPRVSYVHGRGSVVGKTNITGYYGARMLNIPYSTAQRIAQLHADLSKHHHSSSLSVPEMARQMPLLFGEVIDILRSGTTLTGTEVLRDLAHNKLTDHPQGIFVNSKPNIKNSIYAHTTENPDEARKQALSAASSGASVIISGSRDALQAVSDRYPNAALILMENIKDDTRHPVVRGLRPLAEELRKSIDASCLVVSGTSGKTTTQDLARSILSPITNLTSTHGNDNNIWGTTIELLRLTEENDCLLFELGTNGHGQSTILSQLVKPNISYTTSIGIDHWNAVSSIEEMLQLETEQYEWMLKNVTNPIFLANIDHPVLKEYFQQNMGRFIFGGAQVFTLSAIPGSNAHFQLESIEEFATDSIFYSHMVVSTPYGKVDAEVPLIGEHNHSNVIGAIALALSTGKARIADVQRGLTNPHFTGNRSEFFRTPLGDALVFNDSRISSPNAFPFAVKALMKAKEIHPEITRAILVLGDMWNLGEHAPRLHKDMGQVARELGVDALYAHGPHAQNYFEGFDGEGKIFATREELYHWLQENELAGDQAKNTVLLLKGGRKTLTYEMAEWFREGREI